MQDGGEEKRFGEPKGVIAEAWGGPGSDDGSGQEAEADEAEVAGLGNAFFPDFGIGGCGGVEEAFGHVAEIAGDEGGVEGESLDATVGGDLEGGDSGDDEGKDHVGEGEREPAEEEEGEAFGEEADVEDGTLFEACACDF